MSHLRSNQTHTLPLHLPSLEPVQVECTSFSAVSSESALLRSLNVFASKQKDSVWNEILLVWSQNNQKLSRCPLVDAFYWWVRSQYAGDSRCTLNITRLLPIRKWLRLSIFAPIPLFPSTIPDRCNFQSSKCWSPLKSRFVWSFPTGSWKFGQRIDIFIAYPRLPPTSTAKVDEIL